MSTTQARRIRRIGLLPTTFKEVKEERKVMKDGVEDRVETITKRIPIRHREPLAPEQVSALANQITLDARAKRKARRASEKKAKK